MNYLNLLQVVTLKMNMVKIHKIQKEKNIKTLLRSIDEINSNNLKLDFKNFDSKFSKPLEDCQSNLAKTLSDIRSYKEKLDDKDAIDEV